MFTGIIEEVGIVKSNEKGRMWIECGFAGGLSVGQSVACNGVCLTVTQVAKDRENPRNSSFCVEMMEETMKRSNFGGMLPGYSVNLERAMRADGRFDGHIVQGHTDGVGIINDQFSIFNGEVDMKMLRVKISGGLEKYVVEKGSICLNGISLTVVSVVDDLITVGIVPHTWEVTNLKVLSVGCFLNVEVDVVGKYVEKMMR